MPASFPASIMNQKIRPKGIPRDSITAELALEYKSLRIPTDHDMLSLKL
jgi:hypothetical protein